MRDHYYLLALHRANQGGWDWYPERGENIDIAIYCNIVIFILIIIGLIRYKYLFIAKLFPMLLQYIAKIPSLQAVVVRRASLNYYDYRSLFPKIKHADETFML
jgi:hypothetical protein